VCALLTATAPALGQEELYHVTTLGILPGGIGSAAEDINDLGQVTGVASANPGNEAFFWDSTRGMIGLGDLLGRSMFSGGRAINRSGHVAGSSTSKVPGGGFNSQAFFWSPATGMFGIGDLPGGSFASLGRDINNGDQITGHSIAGQPQHHEAFLWDPQDGMIGLGDLPGGTVVSAAYGINDHGQVVGWSHSQRGLEAFLWDRKSGMVGLGGLSSTGVDSGAGAINNRGQIAGGSSSPQGFQAVLWEADHRITALGFLPGSTPSRGDSGATDLNEHGQVVGIANRDPHQYSNEIFIWDRAQGMRSLNQMLGAPWRDNPLSIWGYPAINNHGRIVASAQINGHIEEAILLTPFLLSDLNCDELIDFDDLDGLLLYLLDPAAYKRTYAKCHGDWAGDVNQDTLVDFGDVWALLGLLTGQPAGRPPAVGQRGG
jgi:probable HAF family extracellular repeat protein